MSQQLITLLGRSLQNNKLPNSVVGCFYFISLKMYYLQENRVKGGKTLDSKELALCKIESAAISLNYQLKGLLDKGDYMNSTGKILEISKKVDNLIVDFITLAEGRDRALHSHTSLDNNFMDCHKIYAYFRDVIYSLQEVSIQIIFILLGLKNIGLISGEEYKAHTYDKKHLLDKSHNTSIKTLISTLE